MEFFFKSHEKRRQSSGTSYFSLILGSKIGWNPRVSSTLTLFIIIITVFDVMFLLQDLHENVDFEEARARLLKALKVSERKMFLIK